MIIKDVLLLV